MFGFFSHHQSSEIQESDSLSVGDQVLFFQGRRPLRGKISEVQEDGRYLIQTSLGPIVKDRDELKPVEALGRGKAHIRFRE